MKVYLSQIFARFVISKTLVSENVPEFVSGDLKQWCESLGIKKMDSPIYRLRVNGVAERVVQTVKRAIQASSSNLDVSLGTFLQRALMTHRNTSKTQGRTPVELILARKVRLPAVADLNLCEPIFFKPMNTSSTVPATFIKRKGINALLIQSESSNRTVLVSDNQIAQLDPNDIKTESNDKKLLTPQSENSRDNIEVASPNAVKKLQ